MDLKSWKEHINNLQEKIKNNQINYKEFEDTVRTYQDLFFEIQEVLMQAYEKANQSDKEKFEKYRRFYIEFPLKLLINVLMKKIQNNQINYENFNEAVKEYKDLSFEIQKILEYAYKNAKGKDKEELYKLYKKFSLENAGEMFEKLNKLGYALKNNNDYKDVVSALQDQAYRIMEKTRHTQRDEVQYMITRIFVVNKKQIPELLSSAFNPNYPDDLFKTFIYSFLSGILGKTKGGEENE